MRAREIAVRPVQETDRPTVEWLTTQLWGAAEVVVHDGAFYPATLPGFIAECAGRIAGLVTFDVRPGVLEIVTINALDQFAGIGTMLIEAVRAEAKRLGCQQIRRNLLQSWARRNRSGVTSVDASRGGRKKAAHR